MEEKEATSDLFAIRTLSEKTGVNSVTLRAWERRYGLLKPQRTEKGHRLYDANDVRRVEAIVRWIQQGVAVSKVRTLLENSPQSQHTLLLSSEWQQWQTLLVEASLQFDVAKVEHLYHQVFSQYPPLIAVQNWLVPSLEKLGQGASWHFCSTVLSACLSSRLASLRQQYKESPTILIVGRSGQRSLWCFLASAILNDQGFSCMVMPMMSSIENINALVGSVKPSGVIVFADGELVAKADNVIDTMDSWGHPVCVVGASFWLAVQKEVDDSLPDDVHIYSEPLEGVLAYSSLLNGLYRKA